MRLVKGLCKVTAQKNFQISASTHAQLQEEALYHDVKWNINFEIVATLDSFILIRTTQNGSSDQDYLSKETMITLTKKMFRSYFPLAEIQVLAVINIPSAASIVNTEWLKARLKYSDTALTELESGLGIDKSTLSEWINGVLPMNQTIKAMFYYYILHLKNSTDPTDLNSKLG